jgi:hypothetical protein
MKKFTPYLITLGLAVAAIALVFRVGSVRKIVVGG